ncbi:hypothetical protein IWW55_004121 [Coemansia sp. RSA 2706]|nr:hypothetical protein IWW55_004121 [Coemansia sp. RSA 2706]
MLVSVAAQASSKPESTVAPTNATHLSADPPLLGDVVYNFVIGMLTIVNNTIRGYLLLPPTSVFPSF